MNENLSILQDIKAERDENPGFALITVFFDIKTRDLPSFDNETIDDIIIPMIPKWKGSDGTILANNDGTFSYSFHRDIFFCKHILVEVPYWITDKKYAKDISVGIFDKEPQWLNMDGKPIAKLIKQVDKPYLESDDIS